MNRGSLVGDREHHGTSAGRERGRDRAARAGSTNPAAVGPDPDSQAAYAPAASRASIARRVSGARERRRSWCSRSSVADRRASVSPAASAATSSAVRPTLNTASPNGTSVGKRAAAHSRLPSPCRAPTPQQPARARAGTRTGARPRPQPPRRTTTRRRCPRGLRVRLPARKISAARCRDRRTRLAASGDKSADARRARRTRARGRLGSGSARTADQCPPPIGTRAPPDAFRGAGSSPRSLTSHARSKPHPLHRTRHRDSPTTLERAQPNRSARHRAWHAGPRNGATFTTHATPVRTTGLQRAATATFTFDAGEQTVWLDAPVEGGAACRRALRTARENAHAAPGLAPRRPPRQSAKPPPTSWSMRSTARSPLLARAFKNAGAV